MESRMVITGVLLLLIAITAAMAAVIGTPTDEDDIFANATPLERVGSSTTSRPISANGPSTVPSPTSASVPPTTEVTTFTFASPVTNPNVPTTRAPLATPAATSTTSTTSTTTTTLPVRDANEVTSICGFTNDLQTLWQPGQMDALTVRARLDRWLISLERYERVAAPEIVADVTQVRAAWLTLSISLAAANGDLNDASFRALLADAESGNGIFTGVLAAVTRIQAAELQLC